MGRIDSMKRLLLLLVTVAGLALTMGASSCSRARVESVAAMNEGLVMAQQRRQLEAIQKLEQAGSIDPTNDQAFYNLAMVHLDLRDFPKARESMERAIQANGQVANYHYKLGSILLQLEEPDLQGAKAAFERCIALDPSLFKAHFKLGQVLVRLGEEQAALERLTEAVRRGPRFIEGYTELGRLYADLGFLPQAIQVLRSGLEVAIPGSDEKAQLHYVLGTIYQQQRSYDQAIEQFKAGLAIVPGMGDALFALGWTYGLVGNREEGRRFLQKFLESAGPDTPANYTQAARERISQLETP